MPATMKGQQQPLPLQPPKPEPVEVDREVHRIWASRPYWRQRFKSAADLLADPKAGPLLRGVAARLLMVRAGHWLKRT